MIERFNPSNKKSYTALLDFIRNERDEDLYLTQDNNRIYIDDEISLKKLFKNSRDAFVLEEKGDYVAFCLVWKSCGGDKVRHYLKLIAKDSIAASNLLRGFFWNVSNLELFTKINKRHKLLDVFKKYRFKFLGGRGRQILLKRDKFIREKEEQIYIKEEDRDDTEE